MTNPIVDPLVGRTVAQYEIVSRLSGGGMGVVYRAIDHKLDRTVAVKFLPPQWSHDEDAKQRFIREAQAASATDHPNICTIHDIETADDGQLFIVMAYYEGPTLKQRLDRGPLPLEEALDIATQIADGLGKAHGQGVVHRDLKPGNLILTEDGVRIVDFGLATFADALQLTTAGSTLGTAAYLSPEQSKGQETDARADVWSAGVVLYEMLCGHPPFRGRYAEAIAHMIRHDPAPPLREERPEIPEDVEQLVFRALHKDPAVRFQSGRELARALRQVRGLTQPQDLRTPVAVTPDIAMPRAPRRRRWPAAAAAAAALLVATPAWLLVPVEPLAVVVTPVINETGFDDLSGFEFALQEELSAALRGSRVVRAVSSDRVREILRRYRAGNDATSPEALDALRVHTGAGVLLVPMLLHEDGEWSARMDVSDVAVGTRTPAFATEAVTGAVNPELAHVLTLELASLVDAHFAARGPWRGHLVQRIRGWWAGGDIPARFRTMAAVAAFERGLDAYDRLEYAAALNWFTDVAQRDSENPLAHAWRSRTALLMRLDAEARTAGRLAASLSTAALGTTDRLFIAAVTAEADGRFDAAEAAYTQLADRDASNPTALMERGAFLDRRGRDADAVEAYVRAVGVDDTLGRPELELCRLFGPTRLNDVVRAKRHAESAARKYSAVASTVGEAQVGMCLADAMRVGASSDRQEASRHAERARRVLEAVDAPYQLPRALYYQALTAFEEGQFTAAVALNEQALKAAERAANVALEPFVYQNLGAAHSRLGNRRQYIAYSRRGADLFNARGENERAAILQANVGAALIDFGDRPDEGFRLVQNALNVFRRAQSSEREIYALQVSAAYHRYAGRHGEAERLLRQALAVSQRAGVRQDVWALQMDLARSRFEVGDYERARDLIEGGLEGVSARARLQAQLWVAQIETRLGAFEAARSRLAAVSKQIAPDDGVTQLLLGAALGELEFESERLEDAEAHFRRAGAAWGADLPHVRSVEAYAYEGLLRALRGDVRRGVAALERSLAQAQVMGRHSLVARCRLFLARIALVRGRADEAWRLLRELPPDDEQRTIGPELRAQVHYWMHAALEARGDGESAARELTAARAALDTIRERLSVTAATGFAERSGVRRIVR